MVTLNKIIDARSKIIKQNDTLCEIDKYIRDKTKSQREKLKSSSGSVVGSRSLSNLKGKNFISLSIFFFIHYYIDAKVT